MWNIRNLFKTKKIEDNLILKALAEIKNNNSIIKKIIKRQPNRIEFSLDNLRNAYESALSIHNPKRHQLIDIYHDAMRDNHVVAQIQTRRLKVLAENFAIFENQKENKEKTKLFQTPWFRELCSIFVDTQFFGHSLIEFHNFQENEFWNISLIPRRNVEPTKGELFFDVASATKINYRDKNMFKNLIEIGGNGENVGLLYNIVPETIYKRHARQDWSRHSEKFGMPVVHVQTNTRDAKQLDAYEDMCSKLGHNGFIITSTEEKVSNIEATKTDAYKIYLEQINFCNNEIAKGINGQTGTTDEKSFVGAAQVHERILDAYTQADLISLQFFINWELIPFLITHNYPLQNCNFRFLSLFKTDNETDNDSENKTDKKTDNNQKTGRTDNNATFLNEFDYKNSKYSKNEQEGIDYPFAHTCC